ncbi:MAG TPA: M20 family peptidase [Candidatus Binatia bacterium]|jgi:carboxypeptidase PM20D1|nr:M20 family peptidase [Candidatus Binatia bacterium]
MKKACLALLGVFCIFLGVIAVRTLSFTSHQLNTPPAQETRLDRDAMLQRLSDAIRYRTITNQVTMDSGSREFQRFHTFLAKSFPRVHELLSKETIGGHSLLYSWKGRDERLKPVLLMAHMDVVPVDPATESSWHQPPFSGQVADGYIWGRGTMDDKGSVLAILEAAENLLASGFEPQRTFYFAFGHDEEVGGNNGAANIAATLRSRRVELEFVLDEGLNILSGIISGLSSPVALIGIAEKGYLTLRLTTETAGGHSSMPPADTAIGVMSRALHKLSASPFSSRLDGPTRRMLEFIGPEMAWSKRLVLANLWLFDPLVRRQLAASPLTNAAIRTTLAPTIIHAGVQENVLPTRAAAVLNLRLLPGETIASAIEHVRKAIDDPKVQLTPLPVRMEPSSVSDIESPSFTLLLRTIRQTAPEAIVAPSLLVAATDSRHYSALTRNIYRFLPITLRPEDTKRYHGIDERISIQDYDRCVRFYAQLIRNSQK